VRLVYAIGDRDPLDRFRIYVPFAAEGTPIYVHAKLLIVDDEILRIGSANFNNRSMGMDTECDVFIDAARPGNGHVVPAIRRIRHALLAEHCGIEAEKVATLLEQHGSMAAMVEALAMPGKCLAPFVLRPLTDAEKAVADNALLDPERPVELFEPIGRRRGLFRRGSLLRRPR
jgi:phosphatidylserine/phosphatidylglycerophosphate/cardiolipin synthase-like enzyme